MEISVYVDGAVFMLMVQAVKNLAMDFSLKRPVNPSMKINLD